MRRERGAARRASLLPLLLCTACAVTTYSPYPLPCPEPLPHDAFERCRAVLLQHYDLLRDADRERFRLQTAWQPVQDPPGERRASVFRDPEREAELLVVVEFRWLSIPWFGVPYWTEPVGDARAERELAGMLRQALTPAEQAP